MSGGKVKNALRDVAVALGMGFAVGIAVGGILALIGLFAGMHTCLDLAQRILFVIGSLFLILLAVTIMARGKKPNFGKLLSTENWVKVFRVLGFTEVVGLIGVALILSGCLLDVWLVPMEVAMYS